MACRHRQRETQALLRFPRSPFSSLLADTSGGVPEKHEILLKRGSVIVTTDERYDIFSVVHPLDFHNKWFLLIGSRDTKSNERSWRRNSRAEGCISVSCVLSACPVSDSLSRRRNVVQPGSTRKSGSQIGVIIPRMACLSNLNVYSERIYALYPPQ